MNAIEDVARVLESIDAPYALIGAHAVAVRGHPRMTLDFDFLTTDPRVLQPPTWASLAERGATIDPRKGDSDDPLAGVVHIRFADATEADVVLAKWKWEAAVIQRAERLVVGGVSVPVPRTADLILLKLAAGGYVDLQDVFALVNAGGGNEIVREVHERIAALPRDAQDAWQRLLESLT